MKTSIVVIGAAVVGAAGLGIFLYEKRQAAQSSGLAPTASTWHAMAGTGAFAKGTPIAVAIPNPSAAVVTALTQLAQNGTTMSNVHVYPVGSPPPTDWPADDTFGTTALRLYGIAAEQVPFDVSSVARYGGRGWGKF